MGCCASESASSATASGRESIAVGVGLGFGQREIRGQPDTITSSLGQPNRRNNRLAASASENHLELEIVAVDDTQLDPGPLALASQPESPSWACCACCCINRSYFSMCEFCQAVRYPEVQDPTSHPAAPRNAVVDDMERGGIHLALVMAATFGAGDQGGAWSCPACARQNINFHSMCEFCSCARGDGGDVDDSGLAALAAALATPRDDVLLQIRSGKAERQRHEWECVEVKREVDGVRDSDSEDPQAEEEEEVPVPETAVSPIILPVWRCIACRRENFDFRSMCEFCTESRCTTDEEDHAMALSRLLATLSAGPHTPSSDAAPACASVSTGNASGSAVSADAMPLKATQRSLQTGTPSRHALAARRRPPTFASEHPQVV